MAADETAAAARDALVRDGFALVGNVFDADDVREACAMIDSLLAHGLEQGEALRAPSGRAVMQDMASPGLAGIDQPEILYPATLCPALLETRMFRKLRGLACAIGGLVSRSFDHVIAKPPGNRTATHWHQDIALSGLDRFPRALFRSRLHFWIPLQAVGVEDGCMEFVPGSHLGAVLRHRRRPLAQGDGLATDPGDVPRVACPVPLGGLTIHTPWTLHYTSPNRGRAPRIAWIVHFSRTGRIELALKRAAGRIPAPLAEMRA